MTDLNSHPSSAVESSPTPTQANLDSRKALRLDLALLAVLIALSALIWAPRLKGPLDLRYDAGYYYMLGTSLAEGKGYRLLSEPGEVRGNQYPPGLPALVAIHQKMLGTSEPYTVGQAMRWTYLLIYTAGVLAAYGLSRQLLCPARSFFVGLVSLLYLNNWWLSDYLFADVPFTMASTTFLLLGAAMARGRVGTKTGTTLQCLVIAWAYVLRTAGVALMAAWVGEAILQRRWKMMALRMVVCAIPFFLWQAHVKSVENSDEYKNPPYEYQRAAYQFHNVSYPRNLALVDAFAPEKGTVTRADIAQRFIRNFISMPISLGQCVTSPLGYWDWQTNLVGKKAHVTFLPKLSKPVLITLGIVIIIGGVLLARKRQTMLVLYLLASIGLVCMTSWPEQFPRYLAPLTPLLAICLVLALDGAVNALRNRSPKWESPARAIAIAIMAMIVLEQVFTAALAFQKGRNAVTARLTTGERKPYHLFFYDKNWTAFDEALDWLRENSNPGDAVAATTPEWVYLNSKCKAIFPPFEIDQMIEQRYFDSVPTRYVVVDSFPVLTIMERYVRPLIESRPDLWRKAYSKGSISIYERTKVPATLPVKAN